jgi:tRNA threonylcarbamoyladenosine biosynthesis protein TsaB
MKIFYGNYPQGEIPVQILGIDTATLVCSVALVTKDKMLAEYSLQVKKTHSERLLPLIAVVLKDAGLVPGDLNGVAVAAGPGSFTGLRIGIVTAKALGQALDVPLVGISTLEGLAAQHPYFPGIVCPILDARRSQVYNALFLAGTQSSRFTDDRALALIELLAELDLRPEPVLFVGDGVPVYRDAIVQHLGKRAHFAPPEDSICRGASVARLGLREIAAGGGCSWRELVPQYIRLSQAERMAQTCGAEGGGDGDGDGDSNH